MFRTIGKWLISRSLDRDESPAAWLRLWIDRDDQLQKFEQASRQVGNRLKRDVAGWIASQTCPGDSEPSGIRRTALPLPTFSRRARWAAWSIVACGAAAAVLALVRWPSDGDQAKTASHPGDPSVTRTSSADVISDDDREWLIAAFTASRTNYQAFKDRAQSFPPSAGELRRDGAATILEPTGIVGAAVGRALALLGRGMQSEQQQLASDVKAA